jgi:hypothetical protein
MVRVVLAVVRPPIGAGRAVGRLAGLRGAVRLCRLGVRHPRVVSFDQVVQQDRVERPAQGQAEQQDCQRKRT